MSLKTLLVFLIAVSIFSLVYTTTLRKKITLYKPFWCSESYKVGPCTHFRLKYYYDKEKNECRLFVWGGCGGGPNKFDDERMCRKLCLLPKDPPENGF